MTDALPSCPHCGGECVARWFDGYDAICCDNCGMVFILPQHGAVTELIAVFSRRALPTPIDAYPAHGDDWLRLDLMRDVPTERLRVIAVNEREGQATAEYKFIGEVLITQNDSEEDDEPASVCIIKCKKCGWHMFGDGWWEHPASTNFTEAEQIPRYCAHCGRKLGDEAEPEREGAER